MKRDKDKSEGFSFWDAIISVNSFGKVYRLLVFFGGPSRLLIDLSLRESCYRVQ